jgi:heme O synthase-like polyprenyltransferase
MLYPAYTATVSLAWFLPPALLLSGWLGWLALRFNRQPERAAARKLFFCTLAYLPLILIVTVLAWKR